MSYGTDYSSFCGPDGAPDVDFVTMIEGPRVVLESVARGWLMSRGALPWAPDHGSVNLVNLVNAKLSDDQLLRVARYYQDDALKVPGVLAARVRVEIADGTLRIIGVVDLAEGPFPLAVEIGEAIKVLFGETPL